MKWGWLVLVTVLVTLSEANRIRYEAEKAHIVGDGRVSFDIKGYSGSGFVDFTPEGDESTASIIFSVNIPHDGQFMLSFAYVTESESSEVSIHTNGYEHVLSQLAPTPIWKTHTESIPFRQGLNSVFLRSTGSVNIVSIDYVEIDGAIPLASNGATLPYFELEAESQNYNGKLIGPSRLLYQLPTEASGRFAVTLQSPGQYVEFTLTASANAIVVRFSIPDTPNGSGQVANLNVLVDGQFALNLTVSSIFSWAYGDYPFTKNPGDGKPHHFYDEVRALFGKTLPAGTKVRVVAVQNIPYTIDLADFYTAPTAPYPMPTSGFLSITDYGADPSGTKDSTLAFNQTIAAAYKQQKNVWIPAGVFLVNQRFQLDNIVVRGAGPWYTTVKATVPHGVGFFSNWAPTGSHNVQLYDFAILGDTNVRVDSAVDSGAGGAWNGNSIVQNLWIEHTKCGMWLDGPFTGLHITGLTIRDTYADGINLHQGISNVVIEQTIIRNVGDDALAVWAEHDQDNNNTFQFNTIQVPLLANGIALYGGNNDKVTDNYVADSICDGGGLQIGNRYGAVSVAGETLFARNVLYRCGAPSRFGPWDCGSIWAWQEQGNFGGNITFLDNQSYNSSFAAFTFWTGPYSGGLVISGLQVVGAPYVMDVNGADGTIPCDHVIATDLTDGSINSCANLIFVDKGGNSGWNMDHNSQHCN